MTPARFSHRSRLQLAAIAPACRPLLGQSAAAPGKRSAVALVKGDRRRQNVASAMEAIDYDLHAKGGAAVRPRGIHLFRVHAEDAPGGGRHPEREEHGTGGAAPRRERGALE